MKKLFRQAETAIIHVAGAGPGHGCTHLSISLAAGLHAQGYKTAVMEDDAGRAFECIAEEYDCPADEYGCFNYHGIDYYTYRRPRILPLLTRKKYHYIIIDHGDFSQCDKDFFLSGGIPVISCSSRPWKINDLEAVFSEIEDEKILETFHYCFQFASQDKSLQKMIKNEMDALKNVFFPKCTENPFREQDDVLLREMLGIAAREPVDVKSKTNAGQKKMFFLGRRNKDAAEQNRQDAETAGTKILQDTGWTAPDAAENTADKLQEAVSVAEKTDVLIKDTGSSIMQRDEKEDMFMEQADKNDALPEVLQEEKMPSMTADEEPEPTSVFYAETEAGQYCLQEEETGKADETEAAGMPEKQEPPDAGSIHVPDAQENTNKKGMPETEEKPPIIYLKNTEQACIDWFLSVRNGNHFLAKNEFRESFRDSRQQVLISSLANKQAACAFGGMLRAMLPHTRETGKDGSPVIRINIKEGQYEIREDTLQEILGQDSEYVIYPEEDNYVKI